MAGDEPKERLLFPFEKIRESQKDMLLTVENCLKEKKHAIIHAPTGMGKTIATLGPALKYTIANNKTIFFLTSRHTQHMIAIETLRQIKERFNEKIIAVDIIGKKWMCLQPGVERLFSNEFADYCKKLIEEDKCEFYSKLKKGTILTTESKLVMEELEKKGVSSTEDVIKACNEKKICPYYFSTMMSSKANVVIADYFYIFNPSIRENFFRRTEKILENAIIIIDEGHNLGERIRDLSTARLSSIMIRRAIKEAKKHNFTDLIPHLAEIQNFMLASVKNTGTESYVKKQDFIKSIKDYEELIRQMTLAGEFVRESQKQSYLASIAIFLDMWQGPDKGFTRIVSQQEKKVEPTIVLSYRCLDPSIAANEVLDKCHSAIMMSGTLTPTSMYHDLLGFPKRTIEKTFPSPFKQNNRLNMIIPKTSTKYQSRSQEQYKKIAVYCARVTNAIPGNTAIFFPSYFLRDEVSRYFDKLTRKTTLLERPGLLKEEKTQLLEKFKKYMKSGAVLLGVASGSFGEGIDLPGDLLKGVIVVGLPLQRPNLETKALINYFDKKFRRGWDYGYLYPAFNKAIQSSGRCIRSENDKGVIVFLDERYTWRNYFALFPQEWNFRIVLEPEAEIEKFFKKKSSSLKTNNT